MNIREWPTEKVMRLPEEEFGQKIIINTTKEAALGTDSFAIINTALPDRTVIWDVVLTVAGNAGKRFYAGLALGDQVPADEAAFYENELVFPTLEDEGGRKGLLYFSSNTVYSIRNIRKLIMPQGRRIVLMIFNGDTSNRFANVALTISAMPNEIDR